MSMMLEGKAEYNEDTAREEVMSGAVYNLNIYSFSSHMVDRKNSENRSYLLRGHTQLNDRTLAKFSDGTYGIMYYENPCKVFYYSPQGNLIYIDIKEKNTYPHKFYKYDTNGNIINMGVRVSEEETFIYEPNGEMIAHWLGAFAYNSSGQMSMSRKYNPTL